MFNTAFAAINQFFNMIIALFSAGEKVAKSLDNLGGWAETTTAGFVDEAAYDSEIAKMERAAIRNKRRKQLDLEAAADDVQITAPTTKVKAVAP